MCLPSRCGRLKGEEGGNGDKERVREWWGVVKQGIRRRVLEGWTIVQARYKPSNWGGEVGGDGDGDSEDVWYRGEVGERAMEIRQMKDPAWWTDLGANASQAVGACGVRCGAC